MCLDQHKANQGTDDATTVVLFWFEGRWGKRLEVDKEVVAVEVGRRSEIKLSDNKPSAD